MEEGADKLALGEAGGGVGDPPPHPVTRAKMSSAPTALMYVIMVNLQFQREGTYYGTVLRIAAQCGHYRVALCGHRGIVDVQSGGRFDRHGCWAGVAKYGVFAGVFHVFWEVGWGGKEAWRHNGTKGVGTGS